MANFELVSPYKAEDAAWLKEQGCLHPPVRPGNRMPTVAEMKWALEEGEEFDFDYPEEDGELYGVDANGDGFSITGFDWDHSGSEPDDHFIVYGFSVLLPALIRLAGRCGQLFVYPDSGAPPVVVELGLDAEAVLDLYAEACEREDDLTYFYEKMYGPDGLAIGQGG